MNAVAHLLPGNAAPLERGISAAIGRLAPARLVPTLWNPATCPPAVLPYLAWALSVDEWDDGWSVEKKRAVIAQARYIHQHKGTPAAIRRALDAIGQDDAQIIERGNYVKRNGAVVRDGTYQRMGTGGWATYRVVLKRAATIDQAHQIRRLLAAVQRNCIHLIAIDFRQSALRRNGQFTRNGAYTRGVVDTSIN